MNATHLGGIQEANNPVERTASQPNGLQVKATTFGGWLAFAHFIVGRIAVKARVNFRRSPLFEIILVIWFFVGLEGFGLCEEVFDVCTKIASDFWLLLGKIIFLAGVGFEIE